MMLSEAKIVELLRQDSGAMKSIVGHAALGAMSGLVAYYLFDATQWGAFWAGVISGFVTNRLKALPAWKAQSRPGEGPRAL
jgi:hypothetical protein